MVNVKGFKVDVDGLANGLLDLCEIPEIRLMPIIFPARVMLPFENGLREVFNTIGANKVGLKDADELKRANDEVEAKFGFRPCEIDTSKRGAFIVEMVRVVTCRMLDLASAAILRKGLAQLKTA